MFHNNATRFNNTKRKFDQAEEEDDDDDDDDDDEDEDDDDYDDLGRIE